jgi:hypothetical protein
MSIPKAKGGVCGGAVIKFIPGKNFKVFISQNVKMYGYICPYCMSKPGNLERLAFDCSRMPSK